MCVFMCVSERKCYTCNVCFRSLDTVSAMFSLSGLSVALVFALVPSSSEALKDGECEGEFMWKMIRGCELASWLALNC